MAENKPNTNNRKKPRLRRILRGAIHFGMVGLFFTVAANVGSSINGDLILDPVAGPHPVVGDLAKLFGGLGFYATGISIVLAFFSLVLSPFSRPILPHALVSFVVLVVMLISGSVYLRGLDRARSSSHRFPAGNLTWLGAALEQYSQAHDGSLPDALIWFDVLKDVEPTTSLYFATGPHLDPNEGSSYALNRNLTGFRFTDIPKNTVLLFETNFASNPAGGPELISTEHHAGKGCVVLFADLHVEFVQAEDFNDLRWKP
jgi:prepilin-type processing-associated H-X9-DG protein